MSDPREPGRMRGPWLAFACLVVLFVAALGYLFAQDDPSKKEDPAMQATLEQNLLRTAHEKGLQTATFALG